MPLPMTFRNPFRLSLNPVFGQLRKLYKAFQEALTHDLGKDDFADMYAQTIAYGLLAARVSRPKRPHPFREWVVVTQHSLQDIEKSCLVWDAQIIALL